MKTRLLAAALFLLGIICIAQQAQSQLTLQNVGGGFGAAAGGCSQATTVNAALDGSQNTSAVQTAVCGLVTDGVYSLLDGLWVAAIPNGSTNFLVNWANPGTHNLTATNIGNCTFTSNSDVMNTSTSTICNFDTHYNTSSGGGNYVQNSASFGGCQLNNRTAGNASVNMGNGASVFSFYEALTSTGTNFEVNGGSTFPTETTITSTQGAMAFTRTSSSQVNMYLNGSLTANSPFADTSSAPHNGDMFLLALNGSAQANGDNHAYFFLGGGLTATQVSNLRTRLHTYMTTVHGSGC